MIRNFLLLLFLINFSAKPSPTWEIHRVIGVIDGDTIVIENGAEIRYIGIDTPETVHPYKPIECYGPEASERNKELVLNKFILTERDIKDQDSYGRYLRYVYTCEGSINRILVEEGYAFSYYYPSNLKYYKEYLQCELEAHSHKKGLWFSCY